MILRWEAEERLHISLKSFREITRMELFSYYFVAMFLTLLTRMPELNISLFIACKFIIEMWLDLGSHADNAIDPGSLFFKYLYPGYVFLLGSILAGLICCIFKYPSLFSLWAKSGRTLIRLHVKIMLMIPFVYIIFMEAKIFRFINEKSDSVMGLLGILMIVTIFFFHATKLYQRIFSFCIKSNMENAGIAEEKNMEYAITIGGVCSFIVYVSIILAKHEPSLMILRNFTLAILACSLVSLLLKYGCTKYPKNPIVPKVGDCAGLEEANQQKSTHIQEVMEKIQPFQRGRPPVSSFRFNSIRRR